MMFIKRGDIFLSKLIGVGSMQVGERPVVVVSNNKANKYSPTITVVPFTSRDTKAKLPTHIEVTSIARNKYPSSIVLCECITTIDKSLLIEKIGYCSSKEMLRINVAMLVQIGVDAFELIKDISTDVFKCLRRA